MTGIRRRKFLRYAAVAAAAAVLPRKPHLPPNTRATGTGSPAADMDSVVDVLNHSVYQRVFYIDQYGADPTGATLSDTAWTNCYTDAAAAVQAIGGSAIVFGAGYYKFTAGTIAINDCRIALRGQGRQATTIWSASTSGSLVKVTGTVPGGAGQGCAPVSGFTLYGWNGGGTLTGLEYGDRFGGTLTDVAAGGFNGNGFWFHDATALSEGSFISVLGNQNTNDFVFQGNASTGSFDWSHIVLKVTGTTATGSSGACLSVIGHMQMNGCFIQMTGGVQATTGLTKTGLVVGNSGSDVSVISGCMLQIMLEGDTSAGTLTDAVVQGAGGFGIDKCNGVMYFQNVTGTWAAGSVTSPAVFRMGGYVGGPLFSSHGTLTALGTGSQLFTYVG